MIFTIPLPQMLAATITAMDRTASHGFAAVAELNSGIYAGMSGEEKLPYALGGIVVAGLLYLALAGLIKAVGVPMCSIMAAMAMGAITRMEVTSNLARTKG